MAQSVGLESGGPSDFTAESFRQILTPVHAQRARALDGILHQRDREIIAFAWPDLAALVPVHRQSQRRRKRLA